jgi:hypothetical protein
MNMTDYPIHLDTVEGHRYIVEDPIATVTCRIAIKALFLY